MGEHLDPEVPHHVERDAAGQLDGAFEERAGSRPVTASKSHPSLECDEARPGEIGPQAIDHVEAPIDLGLDAVPMVRLDQRAHADPARRQLQPGRLDLLRDPHRLAAFTDGASQVSR